MTLPFVAPPTLPPFWERDRMSHHDWCLWARAYGERYADLVEADDRRLGLTPALSAAVREDRIRLAARQALHYRLDAATRMSGPDPSSLPRVDVARAS